MLSNTCKTAIKAVIYLASKQNTGENTSIKQISEFIGASEHTVGKMLQILVKQDIIQSTKGPSGGFFITSEQCMQPLIKIVEAIDGGQFFKECGLGLSKCSSTHPCPIHNDYKQSRDIMESLFSQKTIKDLCTPINLGEAYLFG